jgi:hypothetical protein
MLAVSAVAPASTGSGSRWLDRITPSRVVAVAMLGSIPVKLLTERLSDPDLWWHLRTGQLIVATHHIPHIDIYSYTVLGKPWVVQEWLSEVIMYGLRRWFGLYGILFFRAVLLFIIYALVARLIVKRMGSGMGAWVLLGLTAYAGTVNWTERPNLFSYLFFVLTLHLIDKHDRSIWWFVPLAVVWANMHGMVIIGVGLVALISISEWLKHLLRWDGADLMWAKRLGLVAVCGLGGTLINPAGPRLLIHTFELIKIVRNLVTEWASPSFHDIGAIIFLLLLLTVVATLALAPSRADPTDIALVLAFTFLALQAVRNLAMSSIVLGVVCARYMPQATAALRARPRPVKHDVGQGSSALMGLVGLLLAVGGLSVVLVHSFPRSDDFSTIANKAYPIAAIDALNVPGVRVFVFDVWSGLVIDRAWPNAHVYADLRTDMYGLEISQRYQRTIAAFPDAKQILDASCTTHVLIRQRDPLAQLLLSDSDWPRVRLDKVSVIFQRRTPAQGCSNHPIPGIAAR